MECDDPSCAGEGYTNSTDTEGGDWNYDYPCGVNGLVEVPGEGCVAAATAAEIIAPPPPPCPLNGIFGDFTTHQGGSPTPVHTIFNPTVAGILDVVIAELNNEGIVPVIEDGFRTESEQADRKKRFKNAAQGLSWHEIGDAIDFQRNSNLAAINAIMLAAGFTPVAGDLGHYEMKIGTLSQSTADACTKAHPNGT